MSSNIDRNLSFAIRIPATPVQSENLVGAVNETLTKFYTKQVYQEYLNFYNIHKSLFPKKESLPKIKSERLILCEINAGLWTKAIISAINSLTDETCPHYIITQNFIHYLLNASSGADFGLIEEYFCKLLITFPFGPQSFDYFWPIVSEPLLIPNLNSVADSGLFFWLLDTLTTCLKNSNRPHNRPGKKCVEKDDLASLYSEEKILEVIDNFNGININQCCIVKRQKERVSTFFELPWDVQISNLLLALSFIYDVLEADFGFWISSDHYFPQTQRPLLSCLLWGSERDTGLNAKVQTIINLYKLVLQNSSINFQKLFVVKKLVCLLAEIMRCRDIKEGMKYPFFGTHSNDVVRQISQILLEHLVESRRQNDLPKENFLLVNLKPAWLRLLLCSHLLSALTRHQCLPELTGVYDILENIAHSEEVVKHSFTKAKGTRTSKNSKLVQTLKNCKSINSKLGNGKTLLHMACEENDAEKVQALLTFPELDVNATDREGWTSIHVAAFKGNCSCVQELLAFNPKSDVQKPVNTRALGPESMTPLMCAVNAGNGEVCQLLLEHTGSVLLDDFNEFNQTPLELSRTPEVTRILKHFKDNHVWTLHSQKDINFDLDFKEIIIRLCVEMVQAYFATHRTWDVYRTLKKSEEVHADYMELAKCENIRKWDYLRYQRDIKRNIYKLRRLVPKLEKVPEFRSSNQIYTRLLTFNKT